MPRAKKTSTKTPSKSDFIRSQPTALSAADVVAKAKTEGIKLDRVLVYKVRIRAKAKGKTKKSSPPTKPSASTAPPKSKAAFVRGLPATTPAKDVVKQAKALGLTLSINYVYNIRGAAKMAVKKKRATAKSPVFTPVTNGAGSSVAASAESLLKAVAAEIGLAPAIAILEGERARVRVVLRG
jgi:hypothetical protein